MISRRFHCLVLNKASNFSYTGISGKKCLMYTLKFIEKVSSYKIKRKASILSSIARNGNFSHQYKKKHSINEILMYYCKMN